MRIGPTVRAAVRADYEQGLPPRLLALRHRVGERSIYRWAAEEGWQRRGSAAAVWPEAKEKSLCGLAVNSAGRILHKLDELLALEGAALAPRDLKSLSSVLTDVLKVEEEERRRQAEDEAAESGRDEWTVNIINQDWGDEDAQH